MIGIWKQERRKERGRYISMRKEKMKKSII